MDQIIVMLTNVPDAPTAEALAHALVEARLAACVNILPGVRSIYRWQDKIENAEEITLVIKTTQPRYRAAEATIRTMHPYELPEVIALPVTAGLPAYLHWVIAETRADSHA